MTVKNEYGHLPAWFDSLRRQHLQPDEIVIVDGYSTDGTWDLLQSYAKNQPHCTVVQHAGNISVGRNVAITLAGGDVIVSTDAGCTHDPFWLAKITAPFRDPSVSFVATAYAPWTEQSDTFMTCLIAAATTPAAEEFVRDWPPSSRSVAFRKSVWQDVGGYPEWLPICEDVVFDRAVGARGIPTTYIREPLVRWRPRTTLRAYLRQVFFYTRGDGHAQLFLSRQLIRYGVYLGAALMLVLGIETGAFWPVILLGAASVLYMKKFWVRFWQFSNIKKMPIRIIGLTLMPLVIALGDIAKMCGWPVGVIERLVGKIAPTP